MASVIRKYVRTVEKTSVFFGKAFSYLIIPMVILQAGEAFLRYIFDSPTVWSWEVAMLLYGAHFIVGAAWVMTYDGHVKTDMLYSKFSLKHQQLLDLVMYPFLFFPFVTIMLWKCTANTLYSISIRETTYTQWAAPLYPLKIVITFAFLLLLLQGIAKWLKTLVLYTKGEEI
ncbi:MAG: TRAP transporter small permease subunit [Desulfitobacterium sp.]